MSQQQLPISIIILTNRADQRFQQSLASTQFAQEVLIIDHHSNNDWQKLKKSYHFTVLKWQDEIIDFSQIRNWANQQANQPWVFFLDSDEVITPKSIPLIQQIIEQNSADLIKVKRLDYFFGQILRHGETGQVYFIRMGKKPKMNWQRAVHEVINTEKKAKLSQITLKHYPHQSINQFINKVQHYAFLEANYRLKQKPQLQLTKVYFQLIFYPLTKFSFNYFIKLGCLDGLRGLIYAWMMSLHSLLVRIYLLEQSYNSII